MIISDIDYHLILLTYIDEEFKPGMKKDLEVIIPDVLREFKGSVEKLKISPDQIYLHFTAGPDAAPTDIVRTLNRHCTTRLTRMHEKLEHFDNIFREDYYIKSGSRPTRSQINDFISIAISGV